HPACRRSRLGGGRAGAGARRPVRPAASEALLNPSAIEPIDCHGVPTATDTLTVRSGQVSLSVRCAGDADRPTLVLIHGYPDTQAVWSEMVERLAPRFRVITYDVRGAGGSSAPRGVSAYHLDRLADDFDA